MNRIKPELDVIRRDERGITRASLMVARAPERPSSSRQCMVTKNNNSHKYVRARVCVKFFLLLFCIFLAYFFFSTLDNHPCARQRRILLPPERFSLFTPPLVFHFRTQQTPLGLCYNYRIEVGGGRTGQMTGRPKSVVFGTTLLLRLTDKINISKNSHPNRSPKKTNDYYN